jgi:predicted RNase H-like HicB family nuclease
MLSSAIKPELLRRKVLLYRDEDGYFIVEVPSLHGCLSQEFSRNEG